MTICLLSEEEEDKLSEETPSPLKHLKRCPCDMFTIHTVHTRHLTTALCEKPKYCGYLLIILTNASLSLPHSSEYRWYFSIIEIVFIHILIFYKFSFNIFVRISVILLCGSGKEKKKTCKEENDYCCASQGVCIMH